MIEPIPSAVLEESLQDLVESTRAESVLEIGPGLRSPELIGPGRGGTILTRIGLQGFLTSSSSDTSARHDLRYDGVVITADLSEAPVDDLPWMVETIFRSARHFVLTSVPRHGRNSRHDAATPSRESRRDWWTWIFKSASARHPAVCWRTAFTPGRGRAPRRAELRQGGRFPGFGDPRVWVLTDHKPGHHDAIPGSRRRTRLALRADPVTFQSARGGPQLLDPGNAREPQGRRRTPDGPLSRPGHRRRPPHRPDCKLDQKAIAGSNEDRSDRSPRRISKRPLRPRCRAGLRFPVPRPPADRNGGADHSCQ